MKPIREVAAKLGVSEQYIQPYGHHIAKVDPHLIRSLEHQGNGRLILVTAITPTPAGEGKTTTSIGLNDALNRIGKQSTVCLREPSLGPCFGMKGGATGGGYAQVVPMERINLHFTGDFHAITSANNLLASMVDNHLYWGNGLGIDTRRVSWRRVLDANDRSLRSIINGVGGVTYGVPREDGFDITAASEVMAILCLATDFNDLKTRLGRIIVGYRRDKSPVFARELSAEGPMAVLLRDALQPNLVQTLENNPAFVHGGPFANIAHGCNSVRATQTALKLSDYVITEAGFGADLGAEKFFDIKCRQSGLKLDTAVLVATIKALKMHGGVAKDQLNQPNVDAVKAGFGNLQRHVDNLKQYGVPVVVAINGFTGDTQQELRALQELCYEQNVDVIVCQHWAYGSGGTEELAHKVVDLVERRSSHFQLLYEDSASLWDKIETIAKRIYRADGITASDAIKRKLQRLENQGYHDLPVCIAKTQYSFSTDSSLVGAPTGYNIPVREIRLSSGANFVVAVCGDIMTMPGLPKEPAAEHMDVDVDGYISGLS
jgi:formate--tetrahydrofolate ligase